jgi:hypothetical protein
MNDTDFIVAECYATGCNVEFYINDIPLTTNGSKYGNYWGAPVNQYIKNGSNSISMNVLPANETLNKDKCLRKPNPGEKVYMKVSMYPKGSCIGSTSGKEIMKIEWPVRFVFAQILKVSNKYIAKPLIQEKKNKYILPSTNDLYSNNKEDILLLPNDKIEIMNKDIARIKITQIDSNSGQHVGEVIEKIYSIEDIKYHKKIEARNDFKLITYPYTVQASSRKIKLNVSAKNWQKASKLKLNDKTLNELGNVVEKIHSIISDCNAESFIELSQNRIFDNCDAYNKHFDRNIAIIKDGFQNNKISEVEFEALDPENFDFKLCANNRLIHCISKDKKPIIREKADNNGNCSYYDVFVGKIKRKWAIIL